VDGSSVDRVVGADISPLASAADYSAADALRYAAEADLTLSLRRILSRSGADSDVNHISEDGCTPLMLAAQHGNMASMGLLLASMADVNICDSDGWTALTWASAAGETSAQQLLLSKNATEGGDAGRALSEALRQKHGSSARALIRAGLGPAAPGTFALENAKRKEDCRLQEPLALPAPGAYSDKVSVSIAYPNSSEESVKLLYTLDGRDPFEVGARYKGRPLTITSDAVLRVVAVKGKDRSLVHNAYYNICHYAVPDEVVTCSLRVSCFPEGGHLLQKGLHKALRMPSERVSIKMDTESSLPPSDNVWVQLRCSDPQPLYRMHVDRSFNVVNNKKKHDAYLTKFQKDLEKAIHEIPKEIKIEKINESGFYYMDFTMSVKAATEMKTQLDDEKSYLLKKAKLKNTFGDAHLAEHEECVGGRMSNFALTQALHASLGKKFTINEILGLGQGQTGVMALSCTKDVAKKVSKKFKGALQDELKFLKADFEEPEIFPDEFLANASINVISGIQANGEMMDAGKVVTKMNDPHFGKDVQAELTHFRLPVEVHTHGKAVATPFEQLEFKFMWDQGDMDVVCMTYKEDLLAHVMDMRAGAVDGVMDGETTRGKLDLNRSISRAVLHQGKEEGSPKELSMVMDLSALPLSVTDIFFVAAPEGNAASPPELKLQLRDKIRERHLTEYAYTPSAIGRQVILCSLSRTDAKKWVVRRICNEVAENPNSAGEISADEYDRIKDKLAESQLHHLNWERRKDLVKLKVLKKLERMNLDSDSQFAQLLSKVLDLPVPLFQTLCTYF
jgi:hypothetical protein